MAHLYHTNQILDTTSEISTSIERDEASLVNVSKIVFEMWLERQLELVTVAEKRPK